MTKNQKESEPSCSFEITLSAKDASGNPTPQKRTYKTNSAEKLASFWYRNQGKPKRRKKSRVPDAKEAEKIVSKMYRNTENKDKTDQ